MFEKNIELANGEKITIKPPTRKELREAYQKAGFFLDKNLNPQFKDIFIYQEELVRAATGLNKEQIDNMIAKDFEKVFSEVNKTSSEGKKQQSSDFLQQSSQETTTE